MTRPKTSYPDRAPNAAGDDRLSNLSEAASSYLPISLVKPNEEHDCSFTLKAIFDRFGCVSDLKQNSLS